VTGRRAAGKRYDRSYFDRWYRSREKVVTPEDTTIKARFALAAAEYMLGRRVQSVLDVGCGEGEWRAVLRRARPQLRYTGVDSSEYTVKRYGRRRGIRHGSFGDVGTMGLRGRFDLVICANVIQYVETRELRRGLRAIRRLTRGLAFLEAFAAEDDVEGDQDGWIVRPADVLRNEFHRAGFIACGMHCWMPRENRWRAAVLEVAEN